MAHLHCLEHVQVDQKCLELDVLTDRLLHTDGGGGTAVSQLQQRGAEMSNARCPDAQSVHRICNCRPITVGVGNESSGGATVGGRGGGPPPPRVAASLTWTISRSPDRRRTPSSPREVAMKASYFSVRSLISAWNTHPRGIGGGVAMSQLMEPRTIERRRRRGRGQGEGEGE